jgi:hypothetical protein
MDHGKSSADTPATYLVTTRMPTMAGGECKVRKNLVYTRE